MSTPERPVLRLPVCATLLAGALFLTGCALPQAPALRPMEISGVLSGFDAAGRSFSLASPGRSRDHAVFWDDSTRFLMEGEEVEASRVGTVLGASVAVQAVPIGGRMVANTVALPDLARGIPQGLKL